jgi:DNA integrity scanning protein DisA with diadenylate cyclase activity
MKMPENILSDICSENRVVNPNILKEVITLALEIAREGRKGRRIGTMFAVSDAENVLKHSIHN